ncbi:inter-alpha-trypsin inhibitor heavy chain H4-like isoform X1 [Pieris napi]|uniref:inter-alpha-trypsin inhibitor heavy chain H4-like isoform X1 n=1 Tax=Pieris napi TaxID=78633 RepID=UPI001FBAAD1E|nr:inter-alpha-trypsin inhibitor heavy chain H4-like isoform X1 [Pieris napi]
MGRIRLFRTILCVSLVISYASSAAVTTQETIVVTRSDIEETSTPTPSASADVVTEEPNIPIKITEMRVHSEIALRYASTAVVTTVRNPAKRSQEAVFRMLLPETAFISGFIMTLDGKSYKAYVKEKEEAKNIYNQAVSQGISAAHVSAKARDSNHFTVAVNVEPNSTAVFNLTYEELLVRRNGVYNHAINLHPGALVPKLKVTVHIKESEKITTLRVPEVKTGNEVDATDADAQNPIAAIDRGHDDREATITFKPDLVEQRRLIDIYTTKSKESASHRPYYLRSADEEKQEGTIGQFVVQYDVDRTNTKDILVNDGYFVHFLVPGSLPPLKKHAVFVLDTSGSMMGRKIEQLREAMQTILSKLNPGDYFSIIEFNSDVTVHNLNEADKPESDKRRTWSYTRRENTVLIPPSLVTPENINKAKVIISRMQAYGGTDIHSALSVAIDLIRKGVDWKVKPIAKENETVTEQSTPLTTPAAEEGRALSGDIDIKNELEPIIIFLTDGDPTEGETNTGRILSHISEKNYGERKATIFALAFGEDADRTFLRKLSLRNEGFMRHIYEAADAALQLREFYQQVSSPLLSNVHFTYPKDQVKEGSVTRSKFRAVYEGSELVVAGRVEDNAQEIEPQVTGFYNVDDGHGKKKYIISPKIPVSRTKNEYMPLERLWAYLTIKQLLDEKDAVDGDDKSEKGPEMRALRIALQYEFVTPLTSLVVVKPNATNAVNTESVDSQRPEYAAYGSPLSTIRNKATHHTGYKLHSLAASLPRRPPVALNYHSIQSHNNVIALSGYMPSAMLSNVHYFASPALPASPMFMSPHADFGSYHAEEEEYDGDISDIRISSSLEPQLASTTPSVVQQSTVAQLSWVATLCEAYTKSYNFTVNGTEISLKLPAESEPVPRTTGGDASCEKAVGGEAGLCVYLTRCRSAKNVTMEQYEEFYCVVGNGYAGICCVKEDVDKT